MQRTPASKLALMGPLHQDVVAYLADVSASPRSPPFAISDVWRTVNAPNSSHHFSDRHFQAGGPSPGPRKAKGQKQTPRRPQTKPSASGDDHMSLHQGHVWRSYLSAGCVELYARKVFANPHYDAFLAGAHIKRGLLNGLYYEQEVKTIWNQIYVDINRWKFYGCRMPAAHKYMSTRSVWFLTHCNYTTGQLFNRQNCDADPQMRIC